MSNETLRKIQLTQLEIVSVIKKIAEHNGIEFYLCAGSALGAVRHQGFIPWDDDLDIVLPREDYDKLLKILKTSMPEEYWLQSYMTDENYWQPFAKVRKKGTIYREKGMESFPKEKCGIWIDIFPLDNAKRYNGVFLKIRRFLVKMISFTLRVKIFNLKYSSFSRRYVPIIFILSHLSNRHLKDIQEKVMTFDSKKWKYYVNLASTYEVNKETYPKEWFSDKTEMKFENTVLPVPMEYDKYLRQLYGNYWELPAMEQRRGHNIDITQIVV